MSQPSQKSRSTHTVLCDSLEGEVCPVLPSCDGQLVEEMYKGTIALVCDTCGTPATRVWDE